MSEFWSPRTLADDLHVPEVVPMGVAGSLALDGAEAPTPPAPLSPEELVQCGCGRRVQPWIMVDVRTLPDELRRGRDYICDGCRTALVRSGEISRPDLLEALGAPAGFVQRHRDMGEPYVP